MIVGTESGMTLRSRPRGRAAQVHQLDQRIQWTRSPTAETIALGAIQWRFESSRVYHLFSLLSRIRAITSGFGPEDGCSNHSGATIFV